MDCILPTECLKVKVAQSCLTLCDPMDYTDHAILQTRILKWVAFPFSRGSSQPRDGTQVSCIAGAFFTNWAIRKFIVQISSVSQSCQTLCDPMDCSMPGFPVQHQLLELAQTHVHQVGDAIQPSHPLSPPLLLPSTFPSIRVFSYKSVLYIR